MKLIIKYPDLSVKKCKIDIIITDDDKIIATYTRREIVFEYTLSRTEDGMWCFSQRVYSYNFVCGNSRAVVLDWSVVK